MIAEVRSNLEAYKVIALTHRHITLPELGQFILPFSEPADIQARLHEIKKAFDIDELLYLSTCNRVLFCFTREQPLDTNFLFSFFRMVNSELSDTLLGQVVPRLFSAQGAEAVQHIFEVAASVDSLVIGEREILRQLRTAYEDCLSWNLTGDALRILMKNAIDTAKAVHSNTRIGEKALSIVALAMQELQASNLDQDARILLVGAGQTNRLVGKFLLKFGYSKVRVYNRTLEKAKELADWFDQGEAAPLTQLAGDREGFDVAIVCTGAKSVIFDQALFDELDQAPEQPKLLIDLAIPNNIDRMLGHRNGVKYIEVEDLRVLAKANMAFRQNELGAVHKILDYKLRAFLAHFERREIEKAFSEMPQVIKSLRQEALEDTFREKLENLQPEGRELLEKMLNYLEKKCISVPMKLAKGVVRE
ncbi:MAG: glutamyl-tRNA reductase [Bacteroidota bacterium]